MAENTGCFLGKGRMSDWGEPKGQRIDLKAMDSDFWEGMGPSQDTSQICPAQFRECCRPMTSLCFFLLLNKNVSRSEIMPAPPLYVSSVGAV